MGNVTRVVTARLEGDTLVPLGSTGDIAPGERLFAVRFLGDLAYLVTFLRIDPLFVVDLSDPAHPTVLGEVELPGFSEYLHPLGDHHLLTIGSDVRGGQVAGARIADLRRERPNRAETDGRAAPPERRMDTGRHQPSGLHVRYPARPPGPALQPASSASSIGAKLLLIAVDPITGFETRGEIGHGGGGFAPCAPPFEFEACPTFVEMKRGLFIDDVVYSISTERVQAHALDDLAAPLANVVLP